MKSVATTKLEHRVKIIAFAFHHVDAYDFFVTATDTLERANQLFISRYLWSLLMRTVAPKMLEIRLHYEKKTWAKTDGIIIGLSDSVQARFDAANGTMGRLLLGNRATYDRFQGQLDDMLQQALLLHKLLVAETRYYQYVCYQIDDSLPEAVLAVFSARYTGPLGRRLAGVHGAAIRHSIALLEHLHAGLTATYLGRGPGRRHLDVAPASLVQLRRVREDLQQNDAPLRELARAGGGGAPASYGTVGRAGRLEADERVMRLAARQLGRLPRGGVLRRLVDKFLDLLDTHRDLWGPVRDFDAAVAARAKREADRRASARLTATMAGIRLADKTHELGDVAAEPPG